MPFLRGNYEHAIHWDGWVEICLQDKLGNVKQREIIHNLLCYGALNLIASHMGQSAGGAGAQWGGIGEDSGPIASGDTDLSTPVGSRVLGTYSHNANTPNWNLSFAFGSGVPTGGGSIRQAAIFTTATGGVLHIKGSFAVVNKGSADILNIMWVQSLA